MFFLFFFRERCYVEDKTSLRRPQRGEGGGEQKTIRGSSYFRKKRKKKENEKWVFVSLFFRLFRFSSLPLALSFAPSSPLEEPTRPPQEEKRKKHKLKVFCLACFCVSLFVKKSFFCFLFFFPGKSTSNRGERKDGKTAPFPPPFPAILSTTSSSSHSRQPSCSTGRRRRRRPWPGRP